jgi:hypothetical protein
MDPTIFVSDLQDGNNKLFFFKALWLLLFEGTFTSFFKDKKTKGSQKKVGIRFYFTY